jgi:ADP-ribose pyrophosphatase
MQKDTDADLPEQVMWEGRFITAKKRGRWEYVGRARGIRAAAIIALDVDPDGVRHVILVSQYRVPLGRFSLEIPAGLVGDDEGGEDEEAAAAAARELEEETGYRAGKLEVLGEFVR